MSRPFAVIGFTVFFTIALLFKFETGVTVAALAVLSVALVVTLLIKSLRKNRVFVCSAASAVLACLLLLGTNEFLYLPAISYNGKTCDISAELISEPEFEYGNCYYTAHINKIDSETVDLKARLVFSAVPDAEPYDIVHGKFTFYIPGESNDATLSVNKSNGIFVGAYPHDNDYEFISVSESEKPFAKSFIDIRRWIRTAVYRVLPNENGALAVALLIGDKSGLSAETLNDFSFIGISHIICVSGYHLSLWSMLVYELLRKTKTGTRLASLISIFPVVFFMFVSGMTYSVVRAGIMTIIYFLSNVLLRKRDSMNSLGFALMLIAVFNPFAMGSASLQLSTLATAGIILYSENFAPLIAEKISKIKIKPIKKSVDAVVSTFMITLAATGFTLPVSLSLYNRFNFIVFAANIIAVPVSGLCMVFCAVGALISCVSTSVINIAAYFGGKLCEFLIRFSEEFADIRFLSFNIESDETAVIIISLFLICIFSLLLAYYGKSYPKLTSFLCIIVFVALIFSFSLSEKALTKIRVVDCGNGTSVVISKNDETVIVGCGGTEFLGSYNICYGVTETGNELKSLIFPDSDEKSSFYFGNVISSFSPEEIFCDTYPSAYAPLVKDYDIQGFEFIKNYENFNISCFSHKGKYATYLTNEDVSALILFDPISDLSFIPMEYQRADVIITRGDYPSGIENSGASLLVVNADNPRGIIIQNELKSMGFNSTATAGCGDIIIKADNGYVSSYRED